MKHWIYPGNPKYYDIIAAFTLEQEAAWPINSNVKVGDYVYLYGGSPYKQILFKCQVTDVDAPAEAVVSQGEKYVKVQGSPPINKSFMLLKTVKQFQLEELSLVSFRMLKQNGLKGSIMGPQCLENNPTLFAYIKGVEAE